MPNGKAWAATYRNHLVWSSLSGWLVKKKELQTQLLATQCFFWLRHTPDCCENDDLIGNPSQNYRLQFIYCTPGTFKIVLLATRTFSKGTYTPRRQMGSKYIHVFQKNSSFHNKKTQAQKTFSSCIPNDKSFQKDTSHTFPSLPLSSHTLGGFGDVWSSSREGNDWKISPKTRYLQKTVRKNAKKPKIKELNITLLLTCLVYIGCVPLPGFQ